MADARASLHARAQRARSLLHDLDNDLNGPVYARRVLQVLDRAFVGLEVERETVGTFITRIEAQGSGVPRSKSTPSTWLTGADTIPVRTLYEHCPPDKLPTSKPDVCSYGFDDRCAALLDFLHHPESATDDRTIIDATKNSAEYLCESWWTGSLTASENTSPIFSWMLFAQTFTQKGEERYITQTIQSRIPVIFIQIIGKLLASQNSDGSWGPPYCAETTAYGILAIIALEQLPYLEALKMDINHALDRAEAALLRMQERWAKSHSLWIGDLDFGSSILSEAYSIAAMEGLSTRASKKDQGGKLEPVTEKVLKFAKVFSAMDHIRTQPPALVKASILEGVFYKPLIQALRTRVFPQTASTGKDKYLDYIPVMWIFPNTCKNIFEPPQYLLDMMVLSMWIFLADEYMEGSVVNFTPEEFSALRLNLEKIHPENEMSRNISLPGFAHHEGTNGTSKPPQDDSSDRLKEATSIFFAFATHVMTYPTILRASPADLLDLRYEVKNYLLHHLTQLEDNIRFTSQPPLSTGSLYSKPFLTPRAPYHTWLHSTGAGHVSGPFSFAFFLCTLSGTVRRAHTPSALHNPDAFSTPRQKLIARSMNTHLGAFCRIYNDYGSVTRDADEGNINSLNFPEFAGPAARERLLDAGVWEREAANGEAEQLYRDMGEGKEEFHIAQRVRVYLSASEQFSDMYLTRDVTNRVK